MFQYESNTYKGVNMATSFPPSETTITSSLRLNKETVELFRAYAKINGHNENEALGIGIAAYKDTELRHVVQVPHKNIRLDVPYQLWSDLKLYAKIKGELLPDAWNCAMHLYCEGYRK